MKFECKNTIGLLQPILIPEWKWEVISMYFITIFPRTSKQHDSIMVVVDKLSNVAHFILMKTNNSTSELFEIFIREIVRLQSWFHEC